ncbi:hypothetical protein ACFVXG_25050 [Kitasatospora sp. NPDC058162]|uniref:hypothetical protein n=1 Tax=Kitasatospora sp. NPDC058162 TaxID=3346362 RepID=UPI0036DF1A6E
MTGTVVVHAERPFLALWRGSFGVEIDGVRVGSVRQGALARFPVPAGVHTVRLAAWDRTRSNTVAVEVGEDREFLVTARGSGLRFAFAALPLARAAQIPWYYVSAVALAMAAVFWAVPGLRFRVRAVGDSYLPADRTAESAGLPEEEHGGNGLWWESDPALAKRFRKDTAS